MLEIVGERHIRVLTTRGRWRSTCRPNTEQATKLFEASLCRGLQERFETNRSFNHGRATSRRLDGKPVTGRIMQSFDPESGCVIPVLHLAIKKMSISTGSNDGICRKAKS